MDNQQPPLPPLLEFSDKQVQVLLTTYAELTNVLASVQFNKPEEDHLRIRQHAALSGKREMIHDLLAHDENVRKMADERTTQALSTNQPTPEE